MTEYLLKSDVMAALDWNRWAASILNALPVTTIPDTDAISRKDLLEWIRFHVTPAEYELFKRIIKYMPSIQPSSKPNCTNVDWQTKITAEPLKLEVGQCYRTRDGRKAFVSAIGKVAVGCIGGHAGSHDWNLDGKSYQHNKYDLIALWDEQPSSGDIREVAAECRDVLNKHPEILDELLQSSSPTNPEPDKLLSDIESLKADFLAEHGYFKPYNQRVIDILMGLATRLSKVEG